MDKKKCNDIVLQVEQSVIQDGIAGDINYFNFHRGRYLRMATQIGNLVKPGAGKKILEIGSHHLHSSLILREMGFEVDAMDVSSFWDLPFVNSRRERLGLGKIVENDLANLPSLAHVEDWYDIVIFTEIMEHITFNPVFFWQQVMRVLKNDGIIYISTPNALTLISVFRTLKNLITFRGIGLAVNEILTMVTYGHHWKEYSAREVKTYFSAMSDGFSVSVKKYHYRQLKWRSFTEGVFKVLSAIGNATYIFADELEVVITVNKPCVWKIEPPAFID